VVRAFLNSQKNKNKSTGKSYYNSKNINRKNQSNKLIISIRLIIRGKNKKKGENKNVK